MAKIHKHFYFLTFFIFLFSLALYTAWIVIIALNPPEIYRNLIFTLSLLTPLFFIFASILYRHYDNIFTRSVYLVSSCTGGIFIYFFLASILISIFYVISIFVSVPYINLISLFLYCLATLFFVIGIIESLFIKITEYKVNTPSQYNDLLNKRFVLVADSHFGPINQEVFARRVFRKILKQNPDAVLFSGDMFDSECYSDAESLKKEIKILTSKVPVFFTPGNHEQYGPFNYFMEIATEGGMTVLIDESVRFLGVPIFGLNFRQNKNLEEIAEVINQTISPNHPSIVLNHEPVFHSLLSKAGAFLVVSGHTHNGQFWPGNYIASKFFYNRFTYGFEKYDNLTSITTSGVGTFGPPMRTFNKPEIVVIEFV